MNKEVKKLFKKFDSILENYELDKKLGQLSIDSIYHLFPAEIEILKHYIEDLQHQVEEKDKAIDEAINFIKNTVVAEYGSEEIINIHEFWFVKKIKEILERGKEVK